MNEQLELVKKRRRELVDKLVFACANLRVHIVSPQRASSLQGTPLEFPAYIPHFGSRAGMLVDVLESRDLLGSRHQFAVVGDRKAGCSYINVESFDGDLIVAVSEMLLEWGYFGGPADKPEFLRSNNS
jgi:hypothetical protein